VERDRVRGDFQSKCEEYEFLKTNLRQKSLAKKNIIFLILVMLSFLLSSTSCSLKGAIKRCKFKVEKIAIKNFNNQGFQAVVTFRIKNPNWIGLTVDQLEYSVLVNDEELGNGKSEGKISIPRNSKSYVDIPLQMKLTELSGSLFKILISGKMEYRVKGKAIFSTFLGKIEYPFDLKKEIKGLKKKRKEIDI